MAGSTIPQEERLGVALLPRTIAGGGRPPRPDVPTPSKNRRRTFMVPPLRPAPSAPPRPTASAPPRPTVSALPEGLAATPTGRMVSLQDLRRDEAPPDGILPDLLFHDAATNSYQHPHNRLHANGTTSSFPPPRFGSFTEPLEQDNRSTVSTPPFVMDGEFNTPQSPIFDWSLTSASDDVTVNPVFSQGFMNVLTQDVDHDVEVLTQMPISSSGAVKERKRGSNYNHDEDIQLCESWMSVTHDPIAANEQPGSTYWQRITDNYNSNKKGHLVERNVSSVEHIWGHIQRECLRF